MLTIVIPARNEEKTILKTLYKISKNVKTDHQIIVVNDQSIDRTAEIVRGVIKSNKNVKVVNTKSTNFGFANAIKLGIKNSKTRYIVIVMADLCDDVKTIDLMYRQICTGWDIVCGSRYMKGGKKIGGPKLQGVLSKMICLSLHYLTGIPTTDVSNAFKMYRKDIVRELSFTNGGVEASMYLTLQAYFNGAKISELPTVWKGRTAGVSKFKIVERTPRYSKIYLWAIRKRFLKYEDN